MELGIIGSSVWQQNMPLLEKLTIDRDIKADKLHQLKTELKLNELIYLATCNRVEFIYTSTEKVSSSRILHRLIDFFLCDSHDLVFFPNDFYQFSGREAINHLFRTVSSMESLVIGETQITGQFKSAYLEATEMGLAGPFLSRLADEALMVAKRVRRETELGKGAQSMASLANSELQQYLQDINEPLIALVGAGTMTDKFARYVIKAGLGRLVFVNRTIEKAEKLAEEYGGYAVSLSEFLINPGMVNAVVSATASPDPIFDKNFVSRLDASEKPTLCVDLAIPRDFSIDLGSDDRVKLIDIPYLKSKSNGNTRKKFIESSKANEILKESVHKFLSNRLEVSIKPIFQDTYKDSLEKAQDALDELFSKRITSLTDDEKTAVSNLVKKLIGYSSFQPAKVLSEHLAKAQSTVDPKLFIPSRKNAG